MIELIALYFLYEKPQSIYGIKKIASDKFAIYFNLSLGSIHPALKRLENSKYVECKTEYSKGGQKKTVYSITEKGKDYFKDLMIAELPSNPTTSENLIKLKTLFIHYLDDEAQKAILLDITKFYDVLKAKMLKQQSKEKFVDKLQKTFLKQNIDELERKINGLKSLLLNY